MKRFLLFLNSLLLICGFALRADEIAPEESTHLLRRYSFQIETGKACMSGLLLASEDDEFINGSMINEFGISAIDFSYSKRKQKVKLLNVVSFLDKWYIRMVLRKDLKFCLHILYDIPINSKNRYEVIRNGDTVSIINPKRKLKYTFTPLNHQSTNDTEGQSI